MNNLETKKYWIWFSLIKSLKPIDKYILLNKYKNPEKIFDLNETELRKINLTEKVIKDLLSKENMKKVEEYIITMKEKNIEIITIYDNLYPKELKKIYDPPVSIYVKGNIKILNDKNISIIGCRESSKYGEKIAKKIAYNLCRKNVNIISGLAKGIDSCAHIGALISMNEINDCGKTIAIIGSGIENIYPKENKMLANKIIELGGIIISEYPITEEPKKMNFPARNRLISGMSEGIIVIEAKEKSGTLITVDFAIEQGKEIYVVPGNIDEVNSVGTNNLIKEGAKMITSIDDIKI